MIPNAGGGADDEACHTVSSENATEVEKGFLGRAGWHQSGGGSCDVELIQSRILTFPFRAWIQRFIVKPWKRQRKEGGMGNGEMEEKKKKKKEKSYAVPTGRATVFS